jgi:glutathione S-transferase
MLKFFGRATSDSVQKAIWMLGETQQPFEHIELGGRFGGLQNADYLRLNPHGQVPTLCDDEVVVWESNAIIRYLAAKHFSGTVWPVDAAQRSYAEQWMEWAQTQLYPDFNKLFWLTVRTPPAEHDHALIGETHARVIDYYTVLEAQLAGRDYVTGQELSIADFPAGATLYRFFKMPIERPALPNITAWYTRLSQRPAYRQHVMVSFEELRGRLAH